MVSYLSGFGKIIGPVQSIVLYGIRVPSIKFPFI